MVRRVAGRSARPAPDASRTAAPRTAVPGSDDPAADVAPAPVAEAAPAAVVRPAESADGPPATPRPVSAAEPDLLVVGRIGKPQGLRGEVTVEVRTDEPDERFADGSVLLVEGGTLTVEGSRYQNGRLVVAFEGVPDRSAAELLRNTLLHVDAATLPLPEDPDVFLDNQLMGLRAELEDGTSVGVVAEVLHLPHGDVLVVKRDDGPDVARGGAREVLVPFLTAMVPVVDVAGGRLVMTPPEGLLELSEPGPEDEPEHDEQAAAEDQPAADVEQAAHEPQDDPA